MAIATKPIPYGLRQVVITPYSDAARTTLGTPVALPNGRTFAFTPGEEFTALRGDDQVVTEVGQGEEVAWSLEAGGISLEAYKVLAGGTITETGTGTEEVKTFKKAITDTRGWFKVEGRAISSSGGDFHAILWACHATGNLGGTLADQTFFLTQASGNGLASAVTGSVGDLYHLIHNETATAISLV